MPDRIVRLVIAGDSAGAVRAMRETSVASEATTAKLETTGAAAEATTVKFDAMAAGAGRLHSSVGRLAGTLGLAGLAFGLGDAIKTGVQFQAQQTQLQSALKATGNASVETSNRIHEALEASAAHGGFAPTVEIQGVTNLVGSLHSVSGALQGNAAAVDIARRLNIGYSDALTMVEAAQIGNARGLQKYIGVVIPVTSHVGALTAAQKKLHPELVTAAKLLDKQATAADVNARIIAKMSGATDDFSKTAAGKLAATENRFESLRVKLGTQLLPVVVKVLGGIVGLVDYFERNRTAAIALGVGVTTVAVAFTAAKLAAIEWAAVFAISPVGLAIIGITALSVELVILIRRFGGVKQTAKALFDWLGNAARNVAHAVHTAFAPVQAAVSIFTHPGRSLGFNTGGLVPGFAGGGFVPGAGPNRDSLLAGLTTGEFVMKRDVVNAVGVPALNSINDTGRLPSNSDDGEILPIVMQNILDGRVLAEATHRYMLRRQARK